MSPRPIRDLKKKPWWTSPEEYHLMLTSGFYIHRPTPTRPHYLKVSLLVGLWGPKSVWDILIETGYVVTYRNMGDSKATDCNAKKLTLAWMKIHKSCRAPFISCRLIEVRCLLSPAPIPLLSQCSMAAVTVCIPGCEFCKTGLETACHIHLVSSP